MLPTTSLVICLVVYIIGIEATRIKTFNGIKTKEYPKSSCNKIQNEISESECLRHCTDTTNRIVMISHDDSTNTCMCCSDITGDDITGPNWKSYVRRKMPCANGYVSYDVMPYQICLKYVPVPVTYESARSLCQTDGAHLFKIDSQKKFDVFKEYHVPIANNTLIQVWIESIKVDGQWLFHDGSPMPNVCRTNVCTINMSGRPEEVHIWACIHGSTNIFYQDAPNNTTFHYSCEYSP